MGETKEEVLWETPIKGKGAYCHMFVNTKTHYISIKLYPYFVGDIHVSDSIFDTIVRCDYLEIHNNILTEFDVGSIYDLKFPYVTKISLIKNERWKLIIYCSNFPLNLSDLERR